MRTSNARILRTSTGNPLPYPNLNDTGNTGALVAENTAIGQATTEMSFGKITLGAYKYTSQLVLVPIELIQDSAFDVQSFVAQALGIRLGRIQNTHFTIGTGTSQPTGIVTSSTLGVTGATGETAKWSYADIINLIHSVDPAYRVAAQFMMHDASASVTEQMLDGNGRPLLNSSFVGINQEVKAGHPRLSRGHQSGHADHGRQRQVGFIRRLQPLHHPRCDGSHAGPLRRILHGLRSNRIHRVRPRGRQPAGRRHAPRPLVRQQRHLMIWPRMNTDKRE
jgi:hypothetical protein